MNKIKKLRLQKNLTQKELAKLINTTVQMISKYENGSVVPTITRAKQLALALDTDIYGIYPDLLIR